ncbi:MAG TPA: insulinase family protein, partial [Nitrospira sp.]|nr:insulinase family protein [Nitrospira sp.]
MISLERACTMGVLILAGLVTAAVPVYANSPSLADRVIEHKLANGMTVLMVERHQAPIVSINMT